MIPKKIHYFWLGGNSLPPLVQKCIATWKVHLPDYEIIRWDETNADLSHPIVKYAIKNKMWAFAVDYMRLVVISKYGGIYLDTDMEFVSNFPDELLSNSAFLGYECEEFISAGVIGAQVNSNFIMDCIREMEISFNNSGFETIPKILTRVYRSNSYSNVKLLPPHVFYPYNPYAKNSLVNQFMFCDVKHDTIAIHHWYKSWNLSYFQKLKNILMHFVRVK